METQSVKELLSKETRDLILRGAQMIPSDHAFLKVDIIKQCPLPDHNEALAYTFQRIDWTNPESVRPYLKLLESLITYCPQTLLNVPQKLRQSLERDGFMMKQGRLVKLQK